ncbi:amidohydrolase [Cryobacterium tepidiphilum]|uniref:Amidohydrolase n=1 Tax=Cryobacterium tepidiphilum TaxID=2486026 RepID=A0A3M8LPM1_9MICO|nr:amidohydrolase [Cryobacterium tepidiphilum]RNE67440.1 amidohydrolase [Cryobacterium tepidiphilum]
MLDTLLTGGVIRTFDRDRPWAEAVGITNGTISFIGNAADAPPARATTALAGRLLTPGIIDSHNHLLLGFDEEAVSLEGATDLADVRRRIREHAAQHPELSWICAENAVYSVVEGRRPNADDLRGLTDRPIFVTTYDQHSVWLNHAALSALGITGGGAIAWGNPELDGATGEPTGWVTDFYTSAMTRDGLRALQRDIPMYSPDRRYRKLLGSLRMAAELGITTVVEPQVPLAELDLMFRAEAEGEMLSRVIAALYHPIGANGDVRRALRDAVDRAPASKRLRLGPVKLYADDVIEPHTAAMLEDYANRPGNRGAPTLPPAEFLDLFVELDRLGFQIHTHATGDWGVRMVLDAVAAAQSRNQTVDRRHGVVHVECLSPEDLPRFRELGVVAAMQPRHASPDLVAGTWMDNIGEERWDRAWRFRSLIDSGAHVAFSSDWQVGEMDPLVGLFSAMTRAGLSGKDAWTPAERVGLDAALHSYTSAGAWAWHAEQTLGTLRPGAEADLVVWSENLYDLEPQELLEQRSDLTIVAGEAIHDAREEWTAG